MRRLIPTLAGAVLLSTFGTGWAQAQSISAANVSASNTLQTSGATLSAFNPRPSKKTRIDYTVWDQLLKDMVFYTGPSLRERASRPRAIVGTRFVHGHTSPYRLEGNKIVFEKLNDEFKSFIDEYVVDLVAVGNRIDIPALARDEQLSYWMNLHNALVIQAIAEGYPTQTPSRLKGPDGERFHDSKRVEIDGVKLSLRNIREDIVYRNWSDPLVIYGFFHGDIGSPSIQRAAFSGGTLEQTLKYSAYEFANSLRAFNTRREKPRVSRHYEDAAPFFFVDFDNDVRSHLEKYMKPAVLAELRQASSPLEIMPYESVIADLTAGDGDRQPISRVTQLRGMGTGSSRPGSPLDRALREQAEKFNKIRKRGLFGTVVIEDIQTEDNSDYIDPNSSGDTIE